jgi:homopolymeric O-antigen transport system ATP-binding protein
MSDLAIDVRDLGKCYEISDRVAHRTMGEAVVAASRRSVKGLRGLLSKRGARERAPKRGMREFWALRDLSFRVAAGDIVGVVGRNGAGKSTLLKVLSRITEPTRGEAMIYGRVGSLLEVGTGFHPELTGRENIALNGAILGMRRREIARKLDEIVAFAEVQRFLDTPVKHYSSGMYLRLAFAVAAHLEQEILLIDEVLAVGDAAFQRKCIDKMGDVARQGRTVLFVSHNMGAIRSLCGSAVVLSEGSLAFAGEVRESINYYYRSIGALDVPEDADGIGAPAASRRRFGPLTLNGRRDGSAHQGEPLTIDSTLEVRDGVTGFTIFCIIEDMHGRGIVHAREESPTLGIVNPSAGQHAIRVTLPPLWLNPGLYSVSLKVLFWGEAASARHVSDPWPLDIVGSSAATDAVLHPHVSWDIAPAEPR